MKTFEERKEEMVDWCKKEYVEKNKQWWKTNKVVYKKTKELVPDLDDFVQTSNSFFVKKDFHSQLLGISVAVIFGLIFLKIIFEQGHIAILIVCVAIFFIILTFLIFELKDKSTKVILTKDCFWFDRMKKHVPWEFLVASFVKEDHRSENTSFYLVLHYYNEIIDEFVKFEYSYLGLEMEIEDICFHIEKFKEKSINYER
jgi:hypothetical protein